MLMIEDAVPSQSNTPQQTLNASERTDATSLFTEPPQLLQPTKKRTYETRNSKNNQKPATTQDDNMVDVDASPPSKRRKVTSVHSTDDDDDMNDDNTHQIQHQRNKKQQRDEEADSTISTRPHQGMINGNNQDDSIHK